MILGSSLAPLTVWWFVLLPGNFTIDSIDVVNQVRTDTWNDWHTNAYTSFTWVTSFGARVWSFVTLGQVILMAIGVASLGWAFRDNVASLKVTAITCAVFSALPQVGSFTVTMWKDVPSTAGAMMLTAGLIEWRRRISPIRHAMALSAIGALLVASFRWNGSVALGILIGIMLVTHRRAAKPIVTVIALAALLALGSLVLPQRLNLANSTTWFNFEVRELHDLAYVYNSKPSSFRDPDIALLRSVMPLSEWALGGSSCEGVEVLQYKSFARNAPTSFDAANGQRIALRKLWRQVVFRAPLQVAIVRICRAGGVLSPIFFGQQPTLGLWHDDATDPELKRAKYIPIAESALTSLIRSISRSELSKTVFLNAMLWMMVATTVAGSQRRVSIELKTVLAVGFSIMTSVSLGANAHDARYVAGALLGAQFFVVFNTMRGLQVLRRHRTTKRA